MKFISLTWIHLQQDGFISLMGYFYFLYQTFGAVDWKQARRTNSSSPLGELFDHGCDALAFRNHGLWEHCYVWKGQLLVLGNFSCSILLSYMGTLFHQYADPSRR